MMSGIPKGGVSPGSSGLEAITGHGGQRDGRSRLIEFETRPGRGERGEPHTALSDNHSKGGLRWWIDDDEDLVAGC